LELPKPAHLVSRHRLALNPLVHGIAADSQVSSGLFNGQPALLHDGPSLPNGRSLWGLDDVASGHTARFTSVLLATIGTDRTSFRVEAQGDVTPKEPEKLPCVRGVNRV